MSMSMSGPLVSASPVKGTPATPEDDTKIDISDVEVEVCTRPFDHESALNVLSPYVAVSSPSICLDPITGFATEKSVVINSVSPLVQLSNLDIEMAFTDDVLLLNALPCWSQAEIMQQWDLEWERHHGDPEWERRAEFGELPEELVYRPASDFSTPKVIMLRR